MTFLSRGKKPLAMSSVRAVFLSAILMGSLVAVGHMMAAATPALADSSYGKGFPHGDNKDKTLDPNFDIKNVHDEGNGAVTVEVFGQAGGTTPAKPAAGELGQVFVYAFFTDAGIYVINAHWECHVGLTCDPEETQVSEWHAEKVEVANVEGYSNPCVVEITNERPAVMDGHKGTVMIPEATKVFTAQTASFDIKTNPDAPTQTCIAELNTVFDETG